MKRPRPPGGYFNSAAETVIVEDVTLAPLIADGRIFRLNGQPWRYKGISAFPLLDRFANGEDVGWLNQAFPRANTLRVWSYVEDPPWHPAWDVLPADAVVAFIHTLGGMGWGVELTLMTSDVPYRYGYAMALAERLAAENPPNLFIEIGNEPLTNNKRIDVARFYPILRGSPLLWASGLYEDETRIEGTHLVHHSQRTADWPRRAHDAREFFDGTGPNRPHPPLHMPCVLDEPMRPDAAPGDRAQKIRDYRAYGGAAALMGAGATFHSEAGKTLNHPTDDEQACADALFEGLDAFSADAPLGDYRRIIEPGQDADARTYVVGNCMVRCQQRGTDAPEPGWLPIDQDGVLWRR